MGKRELLLIVGFVLVGLVVYQVTAPPPPAGEEGLSFRRLFDRARREIAGNRAAAEVTRTAAQPIDPDVTELWIREIRGRVDEIQVIGEDRPDVETHLRVLSRGYDDEEAKTTAERTVLRAEPAGATLAIALVYPDEGRQTTWLTIRMPSRLRLRLDARPATLIVSDVAAVDATNTTGDTTITTVGGDVVVTHRGGAATIEDVTTVRFTGRNSRLTLGAVRGDVAITMEQGGRLSAAGPGGALEIESRHAEIAVEKLEATRGPIRINATGGSVQLRELSSEARLEGNNTEFDVTMQTAAPLTVYSQGEDVTLTPPPAGCTMDVVVNDGRIVPEAVVSALGLSYTTGADGREQRVSGTLGRGGPAITVRATRGDVILRVPD